MVKKIDFVKVSYWDGVPYSYFIKFKDNSMRIYQNIKDGKTTNEHIPPEALPDYVRRFLESHEPQLWDDIGNVQIYMYS